MNGKIATTITHQSHDINEKYSDLSMHLFVPYRNPYFRDFGMVNKDRKLPVWLWNGSPSTATVTGAIEGDSEGVSATLTAAPSSIPAYSKLSVIVTVTPDGPLEWSSLVTVLSDCPLALAQISLTGTRSPQLSGDIGYLMFGHNWENGLDEHLSWKTDILLAHDRTEQRIQLRTMPRRSWDVRFLVSGYARRKFETWFGMRKTRYLFMPLWRDMEQVMVDIAAGSRTIPLRRGTDNYVVGGHVALWGAWDEMEIRTIVGIGADFISVDKPLAQNWASGASLAPGRYCLSLTTRQVSRFTDDVGDYRLSVTANEDRWEPSGMLSGSYRDVPVCPFVPVWTDDEEDFDSKWVSLDNDTGILEFDIQSMEPVMTREARFLLVGRANINTWLAFIHGRAGRLSPFWLPANDRGFELSSPAATGDSSLVIEQIGYEYALFTSNARQHIEMITGDGQVIRRKVIAVETLPTGDDQLTIDSALPVDISPATLNRCAWLELVRFDSDEITLHWVTPECVEVTVPIMVLP